LTASVVTAAKREGRREGGKEGGREGGREGQHTCASDGRAYRTGQLDGLCSDSSIARVHPHPRKVDLAVDLGREGGREGGRERGREGE